MNDIRGGGAGWTHIGHVANRRRRRFGQVVAESVVGLSQHQAEADEQRRRPRKAPVTANVGQHACHDRQCRYIVIWPPINIILSVCFLASANLLFMSCFIFAIISYYLFLV